MGKSKSSMDGANKKSPTVGNSSSNYDDSNNKPRNLMVVDATTPLQFAFTGRFGILHTITVLQRSDEDCWPGGVVWDLGWCMGQLLTGIMAAAVGGKATTTTTTGDKPKSTKRTIKLPSRVTEALLLRHISLTDCSLVLELGCGVGLTGLIAAAALRAKLTVLTDLKVVVDKVTQPNVELNSTASKRNGTTIRTINKCQGQVLAIPLCWGNAQDEQTVATLLEQLNTQQSKVGGNARKTKGDATVPSTSSRSPGIPDLILIGDVAYQHKPGAPSHFEALVSTLLKFVDEQTIILFGTRIRMPASVDLLDMLLQHFDEIVQPPVTADEIDATAFANVKHNMSIHFLRKKSV